MTRSSLTPASPTRTALPRVLALAAIALAACGSDDITADQPDARGDDRPDASPAPGPDAAPSCDPAAFRAEALPDDGIANTEVRDLHAVAADDAWAATSTGHVLHRDAAGWSQSERLAGPLNGVWAVDRDTTYAVGRFGVVARRDGATWTLERTTDEPGNDVLELRAVHAADDDEVWAVGERALGGPVVLRRDPATGAWLRVTPPAGARGPLRAVFAAAADEVWVAGDDGAFSWDGASWTRRQSGSVAGVVVAGDGTAWTLAAVSLAGDGACRIAAGAAPACEAVAGRELILGKDLTLVDGEPTIAAVASDRGRDVVALHTGASWQLVEIEVAGAPLAVAGTGDALWLGGSEAMVRRGCD